MTEDKAPQWGEDTGEHCNCVSCGKELGFGTAVVINVKTGEVYCMGCANKMRREKRKEEQNNARKWTGIQGQPRR